MLMTITYLLAAFIWALALLWLVKYMTDNGSFWLNNAGGGLSGSRNPQAARRADTNSPLLDSAPKVYLDKAPHYIRSVCIDAINFDQCCLSTDPSYCEFCNPGGIVSIKDSRAIDKAPPKHDASVWPCSSCGRPLPLVPSDNRMGFLFGCCPCEVSIKDSADSDKAPRKLSFRKPTCSGWSEVVNLRALWFSIKDSPKIVDSEPESCQVLDNVEVD